MRKARVLVVAGWLSAVGVVVNAVSCHDNTDQSTASDAQGPDVVDGMSVTPAPDAFVSHDAPENDAQKPDDATSMDSGGDAATSDGAALTDSAMEAATVDGSGDGAAPDQSSPVSDGSTDGPLADEGEADAAPPDGSSPTCGDGAVGATECALQARSADCLACAIEAGCLDPTQANLSCDLFSGAAQSACLDTLICVLGGNGCGVTLGDPSCLCGPGEDTACTGGTEAPAGPCAQEYFTGFGTQNVEDILASFNDPTTPSGDANDLVQCLQFPPCTSCF